MILYHTKFKLQCFFHIFGFESKKKKSYLELGGPNHQFLPNHNRTNYNLRFSPIFELLRGYLVQPVTSSPIYRNILLAENATMVLFVREIIPRVINEY